MIRQYFQVQFSTYSGGGDIGDKLILPLVAAIQKFAILGYIKLFVGFKKITFKFVEKIQLRVFLLGLVIEDKMLKLPPATRSSLFTNPTDY